MPTEAQLAALAAGRAKANDNRRQRAATRKADGLADDLAGATDAPPAPPPDDSPPADTAPRASRGRPAGSLTSGSKPHTASIAKIRAGLVSLFTMSGVGLSMIDAYDGQVVAMNAGKLADSWADLAAQDARVRRALEALLAGSAWGQAITTTAMVALPIAAHHRLAPPEVGMMAAQAGIAVPTADDVKPASVRVERAEQPPDGVTNGRAQRAASAAPAETAPVPPSDEVARWDAGAMPDVVDAGGIEFPSPAAPPSG